MKMSKFLLLDTFLGLFLHFGALFNRSSKKIQGQVRLGNTLGKNPDIEANFSNSYLSTSNQSDHAYKAFKGSKRLF